MTQATPSGGTGGSGTPTTPSVHARLSGSPPPPPFPPLSSPQDLPGLFLLIHCHRAALPQRLTSCWIPPLTLSIPHPLPTLTPLAIHEALGIFSTLTPPIHRCVLHMCSLTCVLTCAAPDKPAPVRQHVFSPVMAHVALLLMAGWAGLHVS